MAWTYDPASIGTSSVAERRNAVRSLIQDTDTNDQQLQDEEIDFFVLQVSNDIYAAAAMACEALVAKYSRFGDTSIDNGGISVDYSDVIKGYRFLASRMTGMSRKYGSSGIGVPRAGGISRAAVRDVHADSDRVDPAFKQRQFRNPPGSFDDADDERIR